MPIDRPISKKRDEFGLPVLPPWEQDSNQDALSNAAAKAQERWRKRRNRIKANHAQSRKKHKSH